MAHLPLLILFCFFSLFNSLYGQHAPHRPGEFLVSLSEGSTPADLFQQSAFSSAEKISKLLNIWLLSSELPERPVLEWLRQQPGVRSAQFNHLLQNRTLPNDPLFPQQWHLLNNGNNGGVFDADLDAEHAWDISTGGLTAAGDTIVIAVIDGGIDAVHPDLRPNLWRNYAEIPNNGTDDDGNGYVDDVRGWNVFTETDAIEGNSTAHGTPVSGILGARGNNGIGVTGVNWDTKIMFVAASGTEARILAAYDYVYQARLRYNNTWGAAGAFVVAVNCSWGINYGQPSNAPLWCEAFDKLGEVGILSVAATANLAVDVDEVGDLPTACPSNFLISVTSLNSSDQKALNAGWGKTHVDLGGYGQEVFTTASAAGYNYFSGTSFAAPQVAGAVGLLYAAPCPNLIALAKIDPGSAAYWAKSLIMENVTPNPSLDGRVVTDGRLNLYIGLQNYQSQCSNCPAPFALKTEGVTDNSARLLWSKTPAALVLNLRWRTLGIGPWTTVIGVSDTFTLEDLFGCTAYEFQMQAFCEGGVESAWSHPFIFETKGCCTAPVVAWLHQSTEVSATLAWDASGSNLGYRVRLRESGHTIWTFIDVDSSFLELQNLNSCTYYEVQVQARCEEWFTGFSPLLSFQTKGCGPCNEMTYCPVMAGNSMQEWIDSVKIGTWLNVSGAGGWGYQNFASNQLVFPHLVSQTAIPVVISPGFSGNLTKEYYRIYVDFNQDGDFDDDGELAFDPGFALEGPVAGLLQVPALPSPGLTRLRVMMKYTTSSDHPPTPCTNFEFGQVEDYCATLLLDSISTAIPVVDTVWLLRAFPQPAHDWVTLEFPEEVSTGKCSLTIVDLTGRTLLEQSIPMLQNGRVYLDVRTWASGMYGVQARCGGKVLRGKLLKG